MTLVRPTSVRSGDIAKNLVDALLKLASEVATVFRFCRRILVYEHSTREIPLLSGDSPSLRRSPPAVLRLLEDMACMAAGSRSYPSANLRHTHCSLPPPGDSIAVCPSSVLGDKHL